MKKTTMIGMKKDHGVKIVILSYQPLLWDNNIL